MICRSQRISEMPAANFADALSRLHALFLASSSEYRELPFNTRTERGRGASIGLPAWAVENRRPGTRESYCLAGKDAKNREIYSAYRGAYGRLL